MLTQKKIRAVAVQVVQYSRYAILSERIVHLKIVWLKRKTEH